MTTHGENIGSRKVEPETQNLPKWRLKANHLMRQLARIWYGKLPVRDYPNKGTAILKSVRTQTLIGAI